MKKRVSRRKLLTGAAALAAYAALPAAPKAAVPGIGPTLLTGGGKLSLMQILTKVGVASNVKCCLDVGSADSYPGNGNKIFDLSGNGMDWETTTNLTFSGTAGGLSPNEYLTVPSTHFRGGDNAAFGSATVTNGPLQPSVSSSAPSASVAGFLRNWHLTTAKFSVILGIKIPASWPRYSNLFQTGAYCGTTEFIETEKGFSIVRVGDTRGDTEVPAAHVGAAKTLSMFRTNAVVGDDDAIEYHNSGLEISNSAFSLVQVAVDAANSAQRYRVNGSSNTTSNSFGGGTNAQDSDGSHVYFPNARIFMDFDEFANPGGAQFTCMALLDDLALTSSLQQSIYLLFKKYRDHTLP